ncbi:MAG: FHA domain-containing protein [Phoenicibacter congonensis]|uniref:FHA domain-containing protein n=1 Tax=Phoenicibacter congonensis TaxID=1944646 RepID=A0AA43RIJ7_9ACTN|nr:FHA domain-containing protein [Phoenicibacter congonensis]
MADEKRTPSKVVFEFLKKNAGLSYKVFAAALIDGTKKYGSRFLSDRIEEKSFLSRHIVKSDPKSIPKTWFNDFYESSTFAWNNLKASNKKKISDEEKSRWGIETLRTVGVPELLKAFADSSINCGVFLNQLEWINDNDRMDVNKKGSLMMYLFVATGCTGNPPYAAQLTSGQLETFGLAMRTSVPDVCESPTEGLDEVAEPRDLYLCRVDDGMYSRLEPVLSEDGTKIGMMPEGKSQLVLPERTVSRRHLKIYKDAEGWWVLGLQSKNGTTLYRHVTGETIVVEPPRSKAESNQRNPVKIEPGDHLHLAQTVELFLKEY